MYKKVLERLRAAVLFCIKWRYLIALVVFIFCVAFKVHGSSINEYNKLFDNYDGYKSESLILGKSRAIRSDEWLVHAPYYMSQYYNDYEKDSDMMSLGGQDMIIGYNAPVKDVTLIAKPFDWGYVMLGNEYGLSWYWCSKLILLVLVGFEACMIVTKKNKKIALLGSIMIAFAPAVQWWFVPHVVDVFFWGMAVFVLAYHFFTSEKGLRILWMVLLPLAVISFVLALFPSLQISVGLVMLALFVACMVRDKKEITFKKKDIWRIVVVAVFAILVLGYAIWTSKDAIVTLYSTVYPGKRVSLGGGEGFKALFTDLTSLTLPFKDITYSNNSEVSTFVQFAPIFLALYPVIWKKMKRDKNMIVGNVLLVCIIVMAVFMLVGFPELLAKLTGFSYIDSFRMKLAYGLTATLFTIWGIGMISKKQIFSKKQVLVTLLIFGFSYVCFVDTQALTYLKFWQYLIIIAGMVILGYLMLSKYQKLFIGSVVILMMVAGATVNPVARGVTALTGHPLEQKIREIANENKDEYWLALNSIVLQQMAIANGARTLNAVNFYPDYEKWKLIDPDKKYDDVYNRYAHIVVSLTDGETEFQPGATADNFALKMSCEDLTKWPAKYLITAGKLQVCKDDFRELYDDTESDYYIYERTR